MTRSQKRAVAELRNRFNLRVLRQSRLELYIIRRNGKKIIQRRMTEIPAAPKSILKPTRPRAVSFTSKRVSFNLPDDQEDSKQPLCQNGAMVIARTNGNDQSGAIGHELNKLSNGVPINVSIPNSESQSNMTSRVALVPNEPTNNLCQKTENNHEENQVGNALSADDVASITDEAVLNQPENEIQSTKDKIMVNNMNIDLVTGTDFAVNNTPSTEQNASNNVDNDLDEDMLLDGAESLKSDESFNERELLQEEEPTGHNMGTIANASEAVVCRNAKVTSNFRYLTYLLFHHTGRRSHFA